MLPGRYDIRDFDAVGDGKTINTSAIQKAIDKCHEGGGGEVAVPSGIFVTGTLFLKDNVELHLLPGATVKGSPNRADYIEDPFPESVAFTDEKAGNAHLIIAYRAENVTISGRGVIDGNSQAFLPHLISTEPFPSYYWDWRPGQMVHFCCCKDVCVKDVKLENSPYWTLFLHGCDRVKIHGLSITNPHWTPNGDGIDVDCCRDVCIDSCQISCGDDGITLRANVEPLGDKAQTCENVVVTNCILRTRCNAIRVGVGAGKINNCTFSNLVIRKSGIGINVISNYPTMTQGTEISRIRFSNMLVEAEMPIYVSTGENGLVPVRDIVFSGIDARGDTACYIGGIPGNPVSGITLNDLRLDVHGGEKNRQTQGDVSGNPEWTFRGAGVPFGICIVEARDIRLDNVCLKWEKLTGLWQYGVFAKNTNGLAFSRVTAASPPMEAQGIAAICCVSCTDVILHSCRAESGTSRFLSVEENSGSAPVRMIGNDFTKEGNV